MSENFYEQTKESKKKFAEQRKKRKKLKEGVDKIIKDIYSKKKPKKKYERLPQTRNKQQPSRSMTIDTTTSAYGDSAKGRPVPKLKEGGMCRGAGAAIKGTKFQGVF
jgi:sRNA-binding protein|tara:strand:+ start:143 stop:463 length:321 start_codon:yes stop_codon:yes gene_type:complete